MQKYFKYKYRILFMYLKQYFKYLYFKYSPTLVTGTISAGPSVLRLLAGGGW